MSFTFNELNLSGVQVKTGSFLKPGKHLVKIKEATMEKTNSGGAKAEIKFEALNGSGSITNWYNLFLPGKEKATQIGREQFKTLLVMGGHPSPDKPGDIGSLKGLVVGISVRENEYEKNGETRKGVEVAFAFDPYELDPVNYKKNEFKNSAPAAAPLLSATGTVINF